MFDEAVAGAAPPAPLKPPRVAHTLRLEGVKKWAPNQKISRKGAKPQRPAKKLKEFELAFLCALAPLREAVDFFTASRRNVCATRDLFERHRRNRLFDLRVFARPANQQSIK